MLDVGISVRQARRRLRWGNLRNPPPTPPPPDFGAAIVLSSSFPHQPTTLFVTRRFTGGVSFFGSPPSALRYDFPLVRWRTAPIWATCG